MNGPRWVYGLPIEVDPLVELAVKKAQISFPIREERRTSIVIELIEKYGRKFRQLLGLEMGYDVFDEDLKPVLVLVLHHENFTYKKYRLEDEEFLRKELEIEEKGRWYRYAGAFDIKQLECYKERALELGPIPSRASEAESASGEVAVCTKCGGSGQSSA
ncbi:hypothetical protein SCHPADRAFT_906685 [Schizopora paradoxa]|uniref:Uncharacterized protein n=1 Tax=Schizopora paradoxa TaxID=27342 RepID=A0A0H2S0U8_9AGAM|nr:hypothetical protein SCHPADRAFT_906685 [Schizopora paradoxa]